MVQRLRSFLILILAVAVIVSIWIGDWIEDVVILAIILLNALAARCRNAKQNVRYRDLKRLPRKVETFGRLMGAGVLIVCGLVFFVGILRSANLGTLFSQG